MTDSLRPHGLWPARLLCPWNPPGKNAGMGRYFLLHFFLTQGLNPGLLHCRQILYHLSPPGVLPDPGTEPCRVYWQADSLLPVPPGKPERLLGDSKWWRKSFDGTEFREEGWLASSEGTEEMASSHVRKAKLDEIGRAHV